ncbi:MAG: CvpA family protein [Planctomycetota bacterium]|jgi:hypothetical protein
MSIGNLVVVLLILACAAYQYKKGTFVKSFAMIIITICSAVVAFAYFELLASLFIGRSEDTRFPALVPWAQPLSFVLLLVVTFSFLQTALGYLTRQPVDFGLTPERVGRVVCGIVLGILVSGLLLTALVMAPLPPQYPYPRFDAQRPDSDKPSRALLNADAFATGWFSIVSRGAFSGKRSFAALHPDFLDQAFLNRLNYTPSVSTTTRSNAVVMPARTGNQKAAAAWRAPPALKDAEGKPLPTKAGHNLTIVRVGIKKSAMEDAAKFKLAQLRLVCKSKIDAENPLAGKALNVYPVGYIQAADRLQTKKLTDLIELKRSDFQDDAPARFIDFAFYVPSDCVPTLVELKQNTIAVVPPLVDAAEAPPAIPFTPRSDRPKGSDAKPK